eukprot:COSAG01_NODE_5847_length_3998_cov_19.111824_6_plen_140_part_01
MTWQYGSAVKATPHDGRLAGPGGRWQQGPIPCPYGSAPSRRVHHTRKLWGIKYDSDNKTEDLNAEEMMKWVVHREKGDSKPDGGLAAMLRYENQSQSDRILDITSDDDSSDADADDDNDSLTSSGGGNTSKTYYKTKDKD